MPALKLPAYAQVALQVQVSIMLLVHVRLAVILPSQLEDKMYVLPARLVDVWPAIKTLDFVLLVIQEKDLNPMELALPVPQVNFLMEQLSAKVAVLTDAKLAISTMETASLAQPEQVFFSTIHVRLAQMVLSTQPTTVKLAKPALIAQNVHPQLEFVPLVMLVSSSQIIVVQLALMILSRLEEQ